jgi:CHAD domain-containing protein
MKLKSASKKPLAESATDKNAGQVTGGTVTIKDSMFSAGSRLCLDYSRVLRSEASGAIAGEGAEHVHRMRIAVRKLRIVLQLWNQYIDKKKTERLRGEIKWLTGILGLARDADILATRFEKQWEGDLFSGPFKDYIRQKLRQRGTAAQHGLVAALSSGRFERMLLSLEHLFDRKALFGEDRPLRATVPHLFGFSVKKAGRFAGRKLDSSELHSLRIAFKRLRYLVDFFGGLYRGRLIGYLRQFKKYQELLGKYCDAQVAEKFLCSLVPEDTTSSPEARQRCLEIGGLIFIQRLDAADQHRRFGKKEPMFPKLLKSIRHRTKRI